MNNNTRVKLLIITYDFPPMGGTAIQRVLSLVKYLPDYSIVPIVLTVDSRDRDDFLEKDKAERIISQVDVYRAFCLDAQVIARKLNYFGFLKIAYKEAKNVYTVRKKTGISQLIDIFNKLMVPDAKIFWTPFAVKKAQAIFSEHKIDAILST